MFTKILELFSPKVWIALIIVGTALGLLYIRTVTAHNANAKPMAFYSTDDGKTTFVDSAFLFPPFDHDGKPAVHVALFTTNGGHTQFIAYLEKYTPEAKARLETGERDFEAGRVTARPEASLSDSLIKKPGDGNPWISRADNRQASQLMQSSLPAGENAVSISVVQP